MVLAFWMIFVSGLAFILGAIMFIPQMRMTLRLKHSGSLSISTMCVQIPLLLVLAASMVSRQQNLLDSEAHGSARFSSVMSWISHVMVGCVQICMLALAVFMNHIRPRLQKPRNELCDDANATTPPNEETPLMEGEDVNEEQLTRTINKTLANSRY